jgi:hypothetical protein
MKSKRGVKEMLEAVAVFVFLCTVSGLFWIFLTLLAAD